MALLRRFARLSDVSTCVRIRDSRGTMIAFYQGQICNTLLLALPLVELLRSLSPTAIVLSLPISRERFYGTRTMGRDREGEIPV